jgi:hypothetical protein
VFSISFVLARGEDFSVLRDGSAQPYKSISRSENIFSDDVADGRNR